MTANQLNAECKLSVFLVRRLEQLPSPISEQHMFWLKLFLYTDNTVDGLN
jgi:hypothetical protein